MKIGRKQVKNYVESEVTLCDICNKDTEFSNGIFDQSEVEIGAKIGEMPHGDCDYRISYQIDICSPCFMEKIKPAIEAMGGRFREQDSDDYGTHTYYQKILEENEKFEWERHDGETMTDEG